MGNPLSSCSKVLANITGHHCAEACVKQKVIYKKNTKQTNKHHHNVLPYQTAGTDPTGGTPTFLLTPWMTQGLKIHIHFSSSMRRCFYKWNFNESIHQLSFFFVEKEQFQKVLLNRVREVNYQEHPRLIDIFRSFIRLNVCVC